MGRDARPEAIDVDRRNAIAESYSHLLRPIAAALARRLPGVSLDDLIQAGALGLLDAASRYTPERSETFGAYVRLRIRGAMLDALEDLVPAGVSMDGINAATDCRGLIEGVDRKQRWRAIEAALRVLSERQRWTVTLRYIDGLTQREAALALGVTKAAVARLEARAVARLRREVIDARRSGDWEGMGRVITMPRPTVEEIAAAVDELGALSVRMQELRQIQDRYDQLRRRILAWYDDHPPGQSFSIEGAHFAAEVSPRMVERRIRSMTALFKELGQRRFLKYCQFPLAALDEIMAPAEQERLVVTSQTGPRRIKVFARLESAA